MRLWNVLLLVLLLSSTVWAGSPSDSSCSGQLAVVWRDGAFTGAELGTARYAVIQGAVRPDVIEASLEHGRFGLDQERQPDLAAKALVTFPAGFFADVRAAGEAVCSIIRQEEERRARLRRAWDAGR